MKSVRNVLFLSDVIIKDAKNRVSNIKVIKGCLQALKEILISNRFNGLGISNVGTVKMNPIDIKYL